MTSVGPIIQPTPAGHRICFRHTVHHHTLVGDLRNERWHRSESVLAINKVLVNLIGEHPHTVLNRPAADLCDFVWGVDRSRRVIWAHK